MKKNWWLFMLLLLGACTTDKKKEVTQLPDYPIEAGVSAPFAGFVGDWLVVAGGCNFPDVPAAEGGQKVYYREVYALNTADPSSEWIRQSDLPFPVAYGAMAETEDGLLCMGGMNADSVTAAVFRIEKVSGKDSFTVRMLPSMPSLVDNGAATRCGNRIYVTGGNQPEKARNLFLLYLFGGFESVRPDSCALANDVLRYDVRKNQWEYETELPDYEAGMPRCLVGAAGVVHGGSLLLTGGVNYQIFKDAMEGRAPEGYMKKDPEWYCFNRDLLSYQPDKKVWNITEGPEQMARAGGVLLEKDGAFYMVCGEIKPGIRSSKVFVFRP